MEDKIPAGRNVALFDQTRRWAYRQDRPISSDAWHNTLLDKARSLNTFHAPLPDSEIRSVAKSISRYTWGWRLSASRSAHTPLSLCRGVLGYGVTRHHGYDKRTKTYAPTTDRLPADVAASHRKAGADHTAKTRAQKTESRIVSAMDDLRAKNQRINVSSLAAHLNMSRSHMGRRYKDFIADRLKTLADASSISALHPHETKTAPIPVACSKAGPPSPQSVLLGGLSGLEPMEAPPVAIGMVAHPAKIIIQEKRKTTLTEPAEFPGHNQQHQADPLISGRGKSPLFQAIKTMNHDIPTSSSENIHRNPDIAWLAKKQQQAERRISSIQPAGMTASVRSIKDVILRSSTLLFRRPDIQSQADNFGKIRQLRDLPS